MKSITYNAGKFLLDGNEVVNPEALCLIDINLIYPVNKWIKLYIDDPGYDGLNTGDKISLPATLRAEVEYQCQYKEKEIDGKCPYPDCFHNNLCRKVVRLVEVGGKYRDQSEFETEEEYFNHCRIARSTGILAVGEADYEPAFPDSKSLIESALPPHEPTPDAPEMQGTFMKMVDAEIEPDKQAIDERVELQTLRETVTKLKEECKNHFNHLARLHESGVNIDGHRVYGVASDIDYIIGLYKELESLRRNSQSSQPPPQAESEEDIAVRFAMYGSGKCTVGDQEFFRGMFRNGHWRKHEINN